LYLIVLAHIKDRSRCLNMKMLLRINTSYVKLCYIWGSAFYAHVENTFMAALYQLGGDLVYKTSYLGHISIIVSVPSQENEYSLIYLFAFLIFFCDFYDFILEVVTVCYIVVHSCNLYCIFLTERLTKRK